MKTYLACLLLGLLAVTPLSANFESVSFEMTVQPQIPAVLRMEGMRDGRVVIALDVSSDGHITDCLVTAASHAALIRPCVEAVKQWRFRAARYEGEPVPARMQISIDLSMTGAVISRTVADMFNDFMEQIVGRPFDYQICRADEIDHPLVAITRVSPEYARDAQRQGVSGPVQVYFYVDEQGNVRLPAVPVETPAYLSAVAVEAMRGWKFEPPTRGGRPVLVAAVQEFNFGGGNK